MTCMFFLVGPTACGKTAVAIEIARHIPVEIVSLDSMNVYRGMDIGTAKPTAAERGGESHHLIDLVEANESFSTGRYVEEVERVLPGIRGRGNAPLFVGGTPLYLKVLTSGLFSGPSADEELRRGLHDRAEREGPAALHEELRRLDPDAARRIHPNDLRRVVRAIEVHHKTGRPISELQTQWHEPSTDRECVIAGISRDRQELYRRIEKRVDDMFARGLVDEVRGLMERFGALGREASQALGYKEVAAHLSGETDLEETVRLIQRKTRRMAKRQMTWFRSFGDIRWFTADDGTSTASLAGEISEYFGAGEPWHRNG